MELCENVLTTVSLHAFNIFGFDEFSTGELIVHVAVGVDAMAMRAKIRFNNLAASYAFRIGQVRQLGERRSAFCALQTEVAARFERIPAEPSEILVLAAPRIISASGLKSMVSSSELNSKGERSHEFDLSLIAGKKKN